MGPSRRPRCRPEAVLVCTLTVLCSSGCATAWARGIVRNEAGQQISAAEIALSAAGPGVIAARGASEFNGCFNVQVSAEKDQSEFVLTVVAPGYKPVRISFDRKERLTALVTLAPEGGPGDGSVMRVADSEKYKVYDEPCIPAVLPAASQIGLR